MKKMKYVFALSLLVSTALRADDSEKLARLVELAEKSEARQARLEAYTLGYVEAVQGFVVNMALHQIAKDKQNMNPQQQQEVDELMKLMGALIGLDPKKVEELLQGQSSDVDSKEAVSSLTPPAPTVLEVAVDAATDSLSQQAAATLDGTH